MCGLPKEIDLSFLVGLEVTQVAIGLHHIALSFHEGSSIDLECEFELSGKLISPDPPDSFAREGSALIKLLGHRVKSAAVEDNGTVRMDFSNEIDLRIFDSNSNYESYKISWSADRNSAPPSRGPHLRKRAFYAYFLAALNFVGFSILAANVSEAFVVPMVLVVGAAGLYTLSLRCPRCGTQILKRKATIDGIELTYWGGFWIPKRCSSCEAEIP